MKKQHPLPAVNPAQSTEKQPETTQQSTPELPAPATDPTSPHNQEPTGDWVASGRAADRRNNEPGMTDEERKRRRL